MDFILCVKPVPPTIGTQLHNASSLTIITGLRESRTLYTARMPRVSFFLSFLFSSFSSVAARVHGRVSFLSYIAKAQNTQSHCPRQNAMHQCAMSGSHDEWSRFYSPRIYFHLAPKVSYLVTPSCSSQDVPLARIRPLLRSNRRDRSRRAGRLAAVEAGRWATAVLYLASCWRGCWRRRRSGM